MTSIIKGTVDQYYSGSRGVQVQGAVAKFSDLVIVVVVVVAVVTVVVNNLFHEQRKKA